MPGPAGARDGRRADPESLRVGSGVPRQRVAAEGLKKRLPRTACNPFELVSSIVRKILRLRVYNIKFNIGGCHQQTSGERGRPADRTLEGTENVARPAATRGGASSLQRITSGLRPFLGQLQDCARVIPTPRASHAW